LRRRRKEAQLRRNGNHGQGIRRKWRRIVSWATKRNMFGDIPHQLFGVATDDELQQQFHVDKELRDKVVDTLIWDKQNIFLSCSSFRFFIICVACP
jgi:hypothetical protein